MPEQRKTLEQVAGEFLDWSLDALTQATALSSLDKATEEILEVKNAIQMNLDMDNEIEEYADILGCIFHSAYKRGHTPYDLTEALLKKLEINKKRKWELGENGTYKHSMDEWENDKDKL